VIDTLGRFPACCENSKRFFVTATPRKIDVP
jgi:hypothetical protein